MNRLRKLLRFGPVVVIRRSSYLDALRRCYETGYDRGKGER